MAQVPLPIASYRLPAPTASSERLVNCLAEQAPKSGKAPALLRRAPGIKSWVDLTTESDVTVRGLCVMGEELYALVGATLSKIAANGTVTTIGAIPGDERVRMQTNGTTLVIVRPTAYTGYSSDGVTVAQITDPVFLGFTAADVAFMDGYLIFRVPDSQQFFNSGLNALTFSALDVASAEASPDNLVSLLVDNREIFLPGSSNAELWYDAANETGSPFSRAPNGTMSYGIAGSAALGSQDNSIFWLANDKTVRRLDGSTPQRVSQYGVDSVIENMAVIDDCYVLTYTVSGHICIAFSFQNEGRTFVYDCSTQEWHERESLGYGAWRASSIVNCYGRQIVGDLRSGKIGYMDANTYAEFGDPQRVTWAYPNIYGDANIVSHRRLEIVVNAGNGLTVGQGVNPLLTLEVSDNGGNTWRTMPTRSMGARGAYNARVVFWNLGSSRNRGYRCSVTDPIPLFTVDTQIEAQGGRF